MKKIEKHMGHPRSSVAEDFKLSKEAKFKGPSLEQVYWKNPNNQRGSIARCSYAEDGMKSEVHYSEGN